MSVRHRIQEARFLFEAGFDHAAFILVATAIAASSRKRYSRSEVKNDGDAFKRYLDARLNYIFEGDEDGVLLAFSSDKGVSTIAEVIYKDFRCSLVHEAELPSDVEILKVNGLVIEVDGDRIKLGRDWVPVLIDAVIHDPHHRAALGDLRRARHDDLCFADTSDDAFAEKWFLTKGRVLALKQFIAATGLDEARRLSLDDLKKVWSEGVIPHPEKLGLRRGHLSGLCISAPSQELTDRPTVLEKIGPNKDQFRDLALSDHGAAALVELAKALTPVS